MEDFDWAGMLQKVAIAALIIIATWILAAVVKWALSKLVGKVKFLQRTGSDGKNLGDSIGQIASLLIWLFGLVAVLQVFALEQVLTPIQGMLDSIMQYLPNIIGAGFVFFIGFVIAKIVRQLVESGLRALNIDRLINKASPDAAAGHITGQRPRPTQPAQAAQAVQGGPAAGYAPGPNPVNPGASATTGTKLATIGANLAFAVVLIIVSVAALQILGISAISDPAVQMLRIIMDTIPAIIAAALILALGYVIAKFAGDLLESTLEGMGTDRAIASMEIVPEGTKASSVITKIVKIAIMVFFGIMAAQALNFPQVTAILNEVLNLGGRVLFGGVIIAAGFLIANLLAKAVGNGSASTVVRYATIVLFSAMGLQYMGIADSIINLAFGAVVVGGALAAALAYGLGGRAAAARSLEKMAAAKTREDLAATADVSPPREV